MFGPRSTSIRQARRDAGLTQAELAGRAGTSQATALRVRERAQATVRRHPQPPARGRRQPACGGAGAGPIAEPSPADHARVERTLLDVLALAEALPTRHERGAAVSAVGPMTLPERLVALHRALTRHRIEHAFGGAIALAYWTLDPRGTSDIDVNLFVPATDCARALRALPDGIAQPPGTEDAIVRDGQTRLWWDETPVDLFFDYAPIHADAAAHRRTVPFAGTRVPVLGPIELAVFKAMFDRTRDWADLEAMVAADTLDVEAVRASLRTMLGEDDERFARLDEAVRRGRETASD